MDTTKDNSDQVRPSQHQQDIYDEPGNLYDNLAPDVSTYVNTNFMEQRIVNSRSAYPSTDFQLSSRVENEMSDSTWMALQQLKKPVQIAQVSWSTTQSRNTQIYGASIPGVLGSVESLIFRTLSMYAFYKLSPCLRIQINATQFHQGQLICCFDPFSFTQIPGSADKLTIFSATGLPNVKIMASDSEAAELCIPFIHPKSYLTTNDENSFLNLGYFSILVLNPLQAADGASNTLSVSVWIYAKDAQVHVPIQFHPLVLEESSGILQGTLQPLIDNIKIGTGQATDAIGNLITGNVGQALRKGQGLVDTLGNVFGFDYPSRTIQPDKTITPIENLAICRGKSQSQRLAVDPFSAHILQDDVASESKAAMDLLSICQMPMLYTQFLFQGTNSRDDLLFSSTVHPCLSPKFTIPGDTLPSTQRTYLSYVSDGFMYWNGGIEYDIEVIATKFHSGKLLFAFVPNTTVIPSYVDASTALPNVIIDLQQSSSTTFKIPWTSSIAMKSTSLYANRGQQSESDCVLGTMVCYVQNTLAFASNVAPSVEINIYIKASKDYGLYIPRRPIFNSYQPPPQDSVQESSGIALINDKNSEVQTSAVLSKGQSVSIPRPHFGEDYSLLDIIKRFTFLTSQNTALNEQFELLVSDYVTCYQPDNFTPDNNNGRESYLCYWARLYCCWSGSLRYKFVFPESRTSNLSASVCHTPDPPSFYIDSVNTSIDRLYVLNGFATTRTNLSQDNALEVEFPYYSKYNMLLTRNLNTLEDVWNNGKYYLVFKDSIDMNAPLNCDIYIAAGDDFRFCYLRPPSVDYGNYFTAVATLPS